MSLTVVPLLDALVSHALTRGRFERVNTHEPKNAPGGGLTCAIWVDRIEPQPLGSGLTSTTGRLTFLVRLFSSMLQEPQDAIDPDLLDAVVDLLGAYSGDFTLGGLVRNVDLLGMSGPGLSAQAGYLNQDGKVYRVVTVTLPLIINDIWDQEA